jgi:hypothetical protein
MLENWRRASWSIHKTQIPNPTDRRRALGRYQTDAQRETQRDYEICYFASLTPSVLTPSQWSREPRLQLARPGLLYYQTDASAKAPLDQHHKTDTDRSDVITPSSATPSFWCQASRLQHAERRDCFELTPSVAIVGTLTPTVATALERSRESWIQDTRRELLFYQTDAKLRDAVRPPPSVATPSVRHG